MILTNTAIFSTGVFRWLAIPLWAAGTIILVWCSWAFTALGYGTPAPTDPPKKLVVRGLYRYVRNPMYLAKALIADLVPPERRGMAYGLYNAAIGLTAFPASAIAGLLWQGAFKWQGFDPAAPFFLSAGLASLPSFLYWRYIHVESDKIS